MQVRPWYLRDENFRVIIAVDDSPSVEECYSKMPYGDVTFLQPDFSQVGQHDWQQARYDTIRNADDCLG